MEKIFKLPLHRQLFPDWRVFDALIDSGREEDVRGCPEHDVSGALDRTDVYG